MATDGHCIQYAMVGSRGVAVMDTENQDDAQVRRRAVPLGAMDSNASISRYDRCPICEVWTRFAGQLRTNIQCPAVQEALS